MAINQNKNKADARLAVCSWSLKPGGPRDLAEKLSATGIRRVQLALNPLRESPMIWEETETVLREKNVEVVSGMLGCAGENYSTLESIRRTGGITPDATWGKNLAATRAGAELAMKLRLPLVTFHAGFLPRDKSDPAYSKMLARVGAVADIFAEKKIALGLETGQETAPALAEFLKELDHPGVCVNFDPANLILYDQGNPVEALCTVSPWLGQVHIKDATRTKIPGTWGKEVATGSGEVDWPALFATLRGLHFTGNLVIEREAGDQRMADIVTARELILRQLQN